MDGESVCLWFYPAPVALQEFETLFSRNIVKAKDKFNHFCVESIAACRGLDVSALKAPEGVPQSRGFRKRPHPNA